jgi:hypothetical protein
MAAIEWPDEGPEQTVWSHIQMGLDLANDEFERLPESLRALTQKLGIAVVNVRLHLLHDRSDEDLLEIGERVMEEQWVRYATEYHLAGEAIQRANQAFDRYITVRPVTVGRQLPEEARSYVREAIRTFMFGFDPACIALCRAALEQVIKDALVARGTFTPAQLRVERPTAGRMLELAKRAGLLQSAYVAAKQVIDRGDTLMHGHVSEPELLRDMARDSIRDLVAASIALLAAA